MAINFPDSPSVNDTHTVGDRTWKWDGAVWNIVVGTTSDHGNLAGLSDDDHTQYLRTDGTRTAASLTVSGAVTVDTDTFVVDNVNDRVGIGTTSPDEDLHINGGSSDTVLRIDTTGADPKLNLTTLGQQDWSIGIDYSDNGKLKFAESTDLSTTTRMTIDTDGHVSIPESIHSPGLVVAMYEFWDNTANRSVTSTPQTIHSQTITTQGNTRLIFQVVTGQFIKSTSVTNLQLRFWVDGSMVSFGDQMLDTDHIGYGQSAMREQMVQVGNTDTLSAGSHTVQVRASAYNTGNTVTLNYQSGNRSSHFFVWEVCT